MGQGGGFCQDSRISSRNLIVTADLDAVLRKELDKVIVEEEKMEGKDPQGGRWKMEDGR